MASYKPKCVNVTVGTTAVQLQSAELGSLKLGVIVQASDANTGQVYVGASDVTSGNGFRLDAGESLSLTDLVPAKGVHEWDLTQIYFVASTAAQAVRVLYPELVKV